MKNYVGLIKWLKWNMKLFTFVKMSLIINCSALSNVLKNDKWIKWFFEWKNKCAILKEKIEFLIKIKSHTFYLYFCF